MLQLKHLRLYDKCLKCFFKNLGGASLSFIVVCLFVFKIRQKFQLMKFGKKIEKKYVH